MFLTNLIVEAKELIRKHRKLIRIADKSADGWRVVNEYVSDELTSSYEDEKRLKRAIDAANRKRRHATRARHGPEKKIKTSLSSTDQQLFCSEPTFSIIYLVILLCVCVCVLLLFCVSSNSGPLFALYSLGSACDPPILGCTLFLRKSKK